jgi:hypothetical protein
MINNTANTTNTEYSDYIVDSKYPSVYKLNFFSIGYKKLVVIDDSKLNPDNYLNVLKYVVQNILELNNLNNLNNVKMYVASRIINLEEISFDLLIKYVGENIIIFIEEHL